MQLAQELQKVANGKSTWAPPRNDKRFNDPAWTENTFYKSLLQGYMAWSQSLQNFAEKAGFEAKEAGRAKFLLSQVSEALAHTNFLLSNPAAIKAAIDSGGKTLLDGYQNFLEDAVQGRPIPSQVDFRSFKVGDNLAVTPGDVVMRHEMFELIQYRRRVPLRPALRKRITPCRGARDRNIDYPFAGKMKQRHVSRGRDATFGVRDRINDIGHRAVKSDASPVQQDNARGDHLTDEVEIVLNDQDAQPLACHQVSEDPGKTLALRAPSVRPSAHPATAPAALAPEP